MLYYPVGSLHGKLTVTAKLAPARPCGVRRHDAALELGDMSPSGSLRRVRARPQSNQQGYPIDSTDPNWWWFLFSEPPTSILYGTAGT